MTVRVFDGVELTVVVTERVAVLVPVPVLVREAVLEAVRVEEEVTAGDHVHEGYLLDVGG